MTTAIFPLAINKSPFWSTDHGIRILSNRLRKFSTCVDYSILLSDDSSINERMGIDGLDFIKASFEYDYCKPFTPQQIKKFCDVSFKLKEKEISGDVVVIDLRDLCLTPNDIESGFEYLISTDSNSLIGVSNTRDSACQWKSYSKYLGMDVIDFKPDDSTTSTMDTEFQRSIKVKSEITDDVNLKIKNSSAVNNITVEIKGITEGVNVFLIPFDHNGVNSAESSRVSMYENSQFAQLVTFDKGLYGIVVVITEQIQSCLYDIIEFFSSRESPWEIRENSASIYDKQTGELLIGRQQFPNTYAFNGSASFIKANALLNIEFSNASPFEISDSLFVYDEFDLLQYKSYYPNV